MSKTRDRSRSRSRSRSPRRRQNDVTANLGSADRELLEICWKPIKDDPANFDAWTHLLQCVEQLDETKPAREAYDDFLKRYPYCYGYWRKYADFEKRHKHVDRAKDVYERGVGAIALSVDLWLAYVAFTRDNVKEDTRDSSITALYERAVNECGLEFRSDKLWEEYIAHENALGHTKEAFAIYDRLIDTPTQMYSAHFEKLQDMVNTYQPDALLTSAEYTELYDDIKVAMSDKGKEVYVVEEVQLDEHGKEIEEGQEGDRAPVRSEYRKRYDDEALKELRVKILDRRRQRHLATEHEYGRYLESRRDWDASRAVYKRACGTHLPSKPNAHLAWAAFEERIGNISAARDILSDLSRRCDGLVMVQLRRIGLERRIAEKMAEKVKGEVDGAEGGDNADPNSSSPKANNTEASVKTKSVDYAEVCHRFEKLIRDPRAPARLASFYAIKFARFQTKARNDRKLAEKILRDALRRDPSSCALHLQLIELAYSRLVHKYPPSPVHKYGRYTCAPGRLVQRGYLCTRFTCAPTPPVSLRASANPMVESEVVAAMDEALHSPHLSDQEKLKMSQRKLEFLEDLSSDIKTIQEQMESHMKLYKSLNAEQRKRKAAQGAQDGTDKRSRRSAAEDSARAAAGAGAKVAPVPPAQTPAVAPVAQAPMGQGADYAYAYTGYAYQQQPAYGAAPAGQYGQFYYQPQY